MSAAIDLRGRKGGEEKPKTPYEATDNLRSVAKAKMLLALGEGEFQGGLTGRDIYLDGTPLLDSNGNENFPGVRWEFRPGSQHQSYIQGMPSVENEISQSIELRQNAPYIRAVSNTQLSAVRLRFRWPALQQQKDNGDVVGYRIEYAIDVQTDGGAYQTVLNSAVDGKTTSATSAHTGSTCLRQPAAGRSACVASRPIRTTTASPTRCRSSLSQR